MTYKDNHIDITELQATTLTVRDLRDIITCLEAVATGLILPDEASASLQRLIEKLHNKEKQPC
jgi:hypothetical protein